ncbi:MAG: tetratricopeptide repeat protein [Gammaproteobacteria bacterium]|nr:tetratricopeptide repeat protein [Gammaproteobacteria bacterium]
MTDSFDIVEIAPLELLRYGSSAISEAQVIAAGDEVWDQLLDSVDLLARQIKGQSIEDQWLDFKELFYGQWQFKMAEQDYFSMPSNSFHSLMTEREGNNVTFSVVLNNLLKMCDIAVEIIDFPGPLVLRIGGDNGFYVDPLNGEPLSQRMLELLVRGHLGDHHRLIPEHLTAATDEVTNKRFLISIKQACLLAHEFELALNFNEWLLALSPDDPQQRMERGFVLQQLDCFKGASDDFSYFIDNCPEDPNAEVLKMHIKTLDAQLTTYH